MPTIQLLNLLLERHPSGTTELPNGQHPVFEVGSKNRKDEVIDLLEESWRIVVREDDFVIDLSGITVMSPSAANALAAGVAEYLQRQKRTIVLINAEPEVLEGLRHCRHIREHPTPPLPVQDTDENLHYVGVLPDRWKALMVKLSSLDGASASELANGEASSKQAINRFSVYLQELYNNGLARREKVQASRREGAERGWTYWYSLSPRVARSFEVEQGIIRDVVRLQDSAESPV